MVKSERDETTGLYPAYTFGYHGQRSAHLHRFIRGIGGVLADIRCSRQSAQPGWSEGDLVAMFKQHYLRLPQLGNENYKGGEIKIAAPTAGITIVKTLLECSPVVLLCQCQHLEGCHRNVVGHLLIEAGCRVTEFKLGSMYFEQDPAESKNKLIGYLEERKRQMEAAPEPVAQTKLF